MNGSAFGGNRLMRTNTAESAGTNCVLKNIEGIVSLSDIVKTSYGVDGMYKLIVNSQKRVIMSRSVASILGNCNIEHPALRMVVEPIAHLAQMGDCTGFLMGVLGEVLKRCSVLIEKGILPTEIASALRECGDSMEEIVQEISQKEEFSLTDAEILKKITSGIVKNSRISELLGESISGISKNGSFPIDSIRVTKVNVGSLDESERFRGMLLEAPPVGSVESGASIKTAIYTCPLNISNMDTKGTVLLKNAEDLLTYAQDDEKTTRDFVDRLTANGVGLIVCNGSVDNLILDYLNEKKVIVLKIHSKFDQRRLCMLFGGRMSNTLRPMEEQYLGRCTSIEVCSYGERKYTKVSGSGQIDTILVRGTLPAQLEESEQLITKAVYSLQVCANESMRTGSLRLLKGASVCEQQIASKLRAEAEKYTDIRQIVTKIFADSIESVGSRSTADKCSPEEEIYDIAAIKERALEYAVVLASDVLSISQMFITKNEDKLHAPRRQGHWDDQD
ncbi:T-complex protein 1 subunit theta [Nematocida minor]|uniref:T-complex protein 1 subunit theta n=1 Tax=Nematocida minor TaxID=1912983 RepID=UPI00221F6EAD|nr:T-complex protein 1 subunit theta [Nematocida minor]KAI5189631.1 T-complex protein 1 subunit theta [Nematocida minor]